MKKIASHGASNPPRKRRLFTLHLFLLTMLIVVATQFLPWFDLSPGLITPKGSVLYGAGGWGLVGFILFCLYVFAFYKANWQNIFAVIAMELGLLGLIGLTAAAFFMWPYYALITKTPELSMSWEAVQPWYWLALGAAVLAFLTFQLHLSYRARKAVKEAAKAATKEAEAQAAKTAAQEAEKQAALLAAKEAEKQAAIAAAKEKEKPNP